MLIEVTITLKDLSAFLKSALPFRLELEKRTFEIKDVLSLEFVEGAGLRLEAKGSLELKVLGMDVPVQLDRARVMLAPKVEVRGGKPWLTFDVALEDMNSSSLPSAFASTVERFTIERVNRALGETKLPSWDFLKTLDFTFRLPKTITTSDSATLRATGGVATTTRDHLRLGVEMVAHFRKSAGAPA